VLVVPDFIANAGGVICAAVEVAGGTQAAALAQVEERIRANTRAVLDAAAAAGITPRAAAVARARRIVHEATALRRFG
jgi:glutamate dehydrogenase (NAD(P)+)